MFKDILDQILLDLSKHRRNREELLRCMISERLNKSLVTYYKELSKSVSYLSDKKAESILKKVN